MADEQVDKKKAKPKLPRKKAARGLRQYPDKEWGVAYYDGPRRIIKKIGSYEHAKAYYDEVMRRKRVGDVLPDPNKKAVTVGDLLDLYLARAENRDSIASAKQWKELIGHHLAESITEDTIREWVRGMRRRWVDLSELAAAVGLEDDQVELVDAKDVRKGQRMRIDGEEMEVLGIVYKKQPPKYYRYRTNRVKVKRTKPALHDAGAEAERFAGLAEASLYRQLAPLSAAYTLGCKKKLVPHNPVADRKDVGLKRLVNQRRRTLADKEELRLLEVFGDRFWPYVEWAVLTAWRWETQFGLRWDSVDLDARQVVPIVKGHKQLPQLLNDRLVEILSEMRQRFPDSEYVFCSPTGARMTHTNWNKRYWRPALALAGIEGFRWHDLRRTTASRLISRGHSLFTIKNLLGHEDQRTTEQSYAYLADENLNKAMADISRTLARKK